jgi:hypothetical protein
MFVLSIHAIPPLGQSASVRSHDSHWGENETILPLATLALTQIMLLICNKASSPLQADSHHVSKTQRE